MWRDRNPEGEIEREEAMSLIYLEEGKRGVIAFIAGSHRHRHGHRHRDRATRRLMDMGLTPGTEVRVVQSAPFRGPIEISVRGSDLVIGRGLANKIYVKVRRDGE
jgi:DtxR family Mn-dependent transcriptional regulator